MARIENDNTTQTQHSLQNERYADYTTTNYFSDNASDSQIQFATQQPAVVPNSVTGSGVGSAKIENESSLLLETENERNLGRLNLMQRPFLTVPYLGRGSVDPTLELQLKEGEPVGGEKKSTSTVMTQSFMGYTLYPTNTDMESRTSDAKYTVEESAMDGWVRGGQDTRSVGDQDLANSGRPTNKGI
tara:strand:+ start:931 stop:1491 length:561 start_codon:yes stop_codon:yes gene_type:complete